MVDPKPITGNAQFDLDLAELFRLASDKERLATARSIVADNEASLESLLKCMPIGAIRLAVVLSDEELRAQAIKSIDAKGASREIGKAVKLVRSHFGSIARHPKIAKDLVHELAKQQSASRDDGENTIMAVGWEDIWTEQNGKLIPSVLLRFRGHSEKLLLASKQDWGDLAFLLEALSGVLRVHMTKSIPIAEADLLSLTNAQSISKRLDSAIDALAQVRDLGKKFGIEMKAVSGELVDDDTHNLT